MVINSSWKASTSSNLRQLHRSIILNTILNAEGISRVMLAERTGLSQMALTRIARELIDTGLIDEVGKHDRRSSPGRRQTGLRICPNGGYVVGLVISGYGHEIVLANALGDIISHQKLVIEDLSDPKSVIKTAAEFILKLIAESGCDRSRVLGIGVAISAIVAGDKRTVSGALNFGWERFNLGLFLEKETGLPVIVEKVADAVSFAENRVLKCVDKSILFLVHAATMLGASIIQDGAVLRNAESSAGQIGHMLVDNSSSSFCFCGRRNCLNTTASGWSVLVRLGITESNHLTTENIEASAQAITNLVAANHSMDTPEGQALFAAGQCLAGALQNICLVIAPNTFLLAGALSQSSIFTAGFQSIWEPFSDAYCDIVPPFKVGTVSASSAAATIALDTFLFSPALKFNESAWKKTSITASSEYP
jgi:predicted NBD/HSP70 family sugar kinase